MRILVIDDSRATRTFLVHLALELGLGTGEAVDGRHALEVLDAQPPFDAALVDWEMPRMNGLDFVRAVRADRARDPMRLLMVSGLYTMEHVTAALEAGATDFLMKPVSRESLEEKLLLLGVLQ